MIVTLHIELELEPGEEALSDAHAVQNLQNALAGLARSPVEELLDIWRAATRAAEASRKAAENGNARRRHTHMQRKELT